MSAFSNSYRYMIENNVRQLYARRRAIATLELTFDEYIETFVPARHRQLVRDMRPLNGHTNMVSGQIDLTQFGYEATATLYINGADSANPPPPLIRGLEAQPDAPPEVIQRIHAWIENGADVHRDFARVISLFRAMNEKFSRAAMRHYWPTIMALCDGNDGTKDLIPELQVMKAPAALKPLPPGYLDLCRKTAATVSTAQLIPTDVEHKALAEIGVVVNGHQVYEEPGLGAFYGNV